MNPNDFGSDFSSSTTMTKTQIFFTEVGVGDQTLKESEYLTCICQVPRNTTQDQC